MRALQNFLKLSMVIASMFFFSCDDEEPIITPVQKNPLQARAGNDVSVEVGNVINFNGTQSSSTNTIPFTFSWTMKSKPLASVVTLTGANSSTPSLTPDVAGRYEIVLTISQSAWTSTDDVIVTVTEKVNQEPVAVRLNQPITTPTTLVDIFTDPAKVDYIVDGDVQVHSALRIDPGVVIAFEQNRGLSVIEGSINAVGTEATPIVFKGMRQVSGFWKGIVVHTNSFDNKFRYVTISDGGGQTFVETNVKANLTLAGFHTSASAASIEFVKFQSSGGYGLYLQGASVFYDFGNNTFSSNTGAAAFIGASQLHKINGDLFAGNNGRDAVETGGPILQEQEFVWQKLINAYYDVTSDIISHAGLIIQPGATFKVRTNVTIGVHQNGYIKAIGTTQERITFTASVPSLHWNGLFFNSYNSNNQLIFAEVSNAGNNRIADADQLGNIAIGHNGSLKIENTVLKNGKGFGLVTKSISRVNQDLVLVNTFEGLQRGYAYPKMLNYPDRPELTGVWLDQWSLNQGFNDLEAEFYNETTKVWFNGNSSPWQMGTGKGIGLNIKADGTYVWTSAHTVAWTGCNNIVADYMAGQVDIQEDNVHFIQRMWRSRLDNPCDPMWNSEDDIEPTDVALPYELEKVYNMITGEASWKLTFFNPDNTSFSLYRRIQ